MDGWIARWWRRVALVVALPLGGCECMVPELEEVDDFGSVCLLGSACPDGTCVLAAFDAYPCCGFGGECGPCDGNWLQYECPDGTCVGIGEPDACCSRGGACDVPMRETTTGGSSSDAVSSESSESTAMMSSDTTDATTTTTGSESTGVATESTGDATTTDATTTGVER